MKEGYCSIITTAEPTIYHLRVNFYIKQKHGVVNEIQ